MEKYSLYVHIPFCEKKCAYCDFLSFASSEDTREAYLKSLCCEIQAYSLRMNNPIDTVFIGGGTPTMLEANQLERLMDTIETSFKLTSDAEITIEMNPKTLDQDKAIWLRDSQINRVSIGVQSSKNHLLKYLDRIHDYEGFLESYDLVRRIGKIKNVNLDLMFAIPEQSLEEWSSTLDEILALDIEHLSTYSLILEEGTPFYALAKAGKLPLPDEETERAMYNLACEVIPAHGLHRYEISNFAKEGYESRHNKAYWTDKNYIGIGLGAASYIERSRYKNVSGLKDYLKYSKDIEKIRNLTDAPSEKRRMQEWLYLGLRLDAGISLSEFNRQFNHPFDHELKSTYQRFASLELIQVQNDRLKLTPRGLEVSNYIFASFLE